MNADKIQLPDFLIADLYKGCLVDIDTFSSPATAASPTLPATTPVEATIPAKQKIKYLGENGKNIVVVMNEPGAVLKEEELTFLTNILKACQLNLADIAIVNAYNTEISYTAMKEQLNAVKILLFDVEPSSIKLPFIIPAFQVQNYAGSAIMLAPALLTLNQSTHDGKLLKTKLWISLKQVFGIA